MRVSLNELRAVAEKATASTGRPWGLAQEAGRAVCLLEQRHLPGAAALLSLLRASDGDPAWRQACPLLAGAYLCDGGEPGNVDYRERVTQPLLLDGILMQSGSAPGVSGGNRGVDIDDEVWDGLSRLARRTYVPDSEASRLKGAGAGLSDND